MNCALLRHGIASAAFMFALQIAASPAGAAGTRGGVTCDQWLEDKKSDSWQITADQFWLLGYLSGLAVGLDTDFLAVRSNDAIFEWIDTYCLAAPMKGTSDAANALAKELIKATAAARP